MALATRRCLLVFALLALMSPLFAVTVYVKPVSFPWPPVRDGASWATAFSTIGPAITAAKPGDEIWVAAGTYAERLTLREGVSLYGGFAGAETSRDQRNPGVSITTVNGSMQGTVLTAPSGITPATVFDGFTVANGGKSGGYTLPLGGGVVCDGGSPTLSGNVFKSNFAALGSAIYCGGSAAPVIANNTFVQGRAYAGGGIYCASGRAPVIRDNVIAGSVQGGSSGSSGVGIVCVGANAAIERNTISSCQPIASGTFPGSPGGPPGGGISCIDSSPVIRNNIITGCDGRQKGGAIYCSGGSPVIAGNTIRNNSALYGGGIHCVNSPATIADNRLSRNHAGVDGGAVWVSGGAPVIKDNVMVANTAAAGNAPISGGGAIYCSGTAATISNNTLVANNDGRAAICCPAGMPAIVNNIVAFNRGSLNPVGVVESVRHNCFYGNLFDPEPAPGPDAFGNIGEDPVLASLGNGDAHIQPDSPCRDLGDDSAVLTRDADADGNARIHGAHVDIGAFESDGLYRTVTPRIVRVTPDGNDANDGATWPSAKRTIQAAVDAVAIAGGGDVWVAQGVYTGAVTLRSMCRLLGGYEGTETSPDQRTGAAETIVDGAGATVMDASLFTVCDSITWRNGTGLNSGVNSVVSFTGNHVYWDAVATQQGITCGRKASVTVTGNVVSKAFVGVYCYDSGPCTVSNNRIDGCADGGLFIASVITSNPVTAIGNVLVGNSDGLYLYKATGVIANNTIVSNGFGALRPEEGGIYTWSADPTALLIENNIVASNLNGISTPEGGGALYTLRNNCFFGNATTYRGLADPVGLNGNLALDPEFVDAVNANYRLAPGSPCIDAGDDSMFSLGDLDIAGSLRKLGAHVDIGAYEFVPPGAFFASDAAAALRIAGGMADATPSERARMDVAAPLGALDLSDVSTILRKAVGLEPNP